MPYNKNKPQGTDSWINSQKSLQQNFQSIFDTFTRDHEAFGNDNEGMHRTCTFVPQTGTPVESLNDSLVLFNAVSALTGINELNMLRVSDASVSPLTERDQNVTKSWFKLPTGIIVKWGTDNNKVGETSIDFPVGAGIPVYNNIYNAYVVIANYGSVGAGAEHVTLKSITTTTLNIKVSTGFSSRNISYIAIGD